MSSSSRYHAKLFIICGGKQARIQAGYTGLVKPVRNPMQIEMFFLKSPHIPFPSPNQPQVYPHIITSSIEWYSRPCSPTHSLTQRHTHTQTHTTHTHTHTNTNTHTHTHTNTHKQIYIHTLKWNTKRQKSNDIYILCSFITWLFFITSHVSPTEYIEINRCRVGLCTNFSLTKHTFHRSWEAFLNKIPTHGKRSTFSFVLQIHITRHLCQKIFLLPTLSNTHPSYQSATTLVTMDTTIFAHRTTCQSINDFHRKLFHLFFHPGLQNSDWYEYPPCHAPR